MTSHSDLLKRIKTLKTSFEICRADPNINLDVVKENHNGVDYRCLLGVYRDLSGVNLSMSEAQDHFGVSKTESDFLFGPSSISTLTERGMMIDAHLRFLSGGIERKSEKAA